MRGLYIVTGGLVVDIPVFTVQGKPGRGQHIDRLCPHQHPGHEFIAFFEADDIPGQTDAAVHFPVFYLRLHDISHRFQLLLTGLRQILVLNITVKPVCCLNARPFIHCLKDQDICSLLHSGDDRRLDPSERPHICIALEGRHLFLTPGGAENNAVGTCVNSIVEIRKLPDIFKSDIKSVPLQDSRRVSRLLSAAFAAHPASIPDRCHDLFIGVAIAQRAVFLSIIKAVIQETFDSLKVEITGVPESPRMHLRDKIFVDHRKIIPVLHAVVFIQILALICIHVVIII